MIRVVDIETTGMEPGEGAEIIELGWWDMHPTDNIPWPAIMGNFGQRFYSPERPCPPEVRAVHHIHHAEYEHAPRFSSEVLAGELISAGVNHLAAHNAEYESKFIESHGIPWLCTYKAALRLWPHAPHHGNQSLMYWLGLDTMIEEGRRHPPHRALPDAYVTAHILGRMLVETTVEQIAQWTTEPRLLPVCPIGKEWKGRPWAEVDSGFLNWMLRQPDMEADYKWNARNELERRRTERLRGD